MCGGGAGRSLDLDVIGAGATHRDVGRHRVIEQQRLLPDIGDRIPQAVQAKRAHIGAIDADGAG